MPPTAAPPTNYRANPSVRLNGQDQERLSSLVVGMVMIERAGGLSSLELRLTNIASLQQGGAETAYDADGALQPGAQLLIGAGDATAPNEIFRGRITALEGCYTEDQAPELIVLAEDALQLARWARRSHVYENASLGDIVSQIARRHGLTPRVSGLDMNFGTQVQLNESDLGFLRRLLARADADLQMVGTELQAAPRAAVRRGQLDLELGLQLRRVRVTADLADQATAVAVHGWDIADGSALTAQGNEQGFGPGEGSTGAELMQQKFSARREHRGDQASFNQAEADALANAAQRRRARRLVRAHGVAEGNPALRVGTHVRLIGLGQWFSNTFYVVEARHLFDLKDGYRTEFAAECAHLGRPS